MLGAPTDDPRPADLRLSLIGLPAATRTRLLFERYRDDDDERARELLVELHLPLAERLARRYLNRGEPREDLAQVAALALVTAIDRFDPDRGVPFVGFAIPTIDGALKRHFRDTGWAVHVPRPMQELALRARRVAQDLPVTQGTEPSAGDVAAAIGTTPQEAAAALQALRAYEAESLDQPAGAGVVRPAAPATDDPGFAAAEARVTLMPLLRAVGEREREVLCMRYFEDRVQAKIAERLGVSQMQVSRLLRRALDRMQILAGVEPA